MKSNVSSQKSLVQQIIARTARRISFYGLYSVNGRSLRTKDEQIILAGLNRLVSLKTQIKTTVSMYCSYYYLIQRLNSFARWNSLPTATKERGHSLMYHNATWNNESKDGCRISKHDMTTGHCGLRVTSTWRCYTKTSLSFRISLIILHVLSCTKVEKSDCTCETSRYRVCFHVLWLQQGKELTNMFSDFSKVKN